MSSSLQSVVGTLRNPIGGPSNFRGEAHVAPLLWEPSTKFAVPKDSTEAETNPHIREGFLRREQALLHLASQAPSDSAERAAYAEALWKFSPLRNPATAVVPVTSDAALRTGFFNVACTAGTPVEKPVFLGSKK